MIRDLLAGVEVLREQRRRHHERVAGVGESLAGGTIDGKLAGRLQGRRPADRASVYVYSALKSRRSTTGPGSPRWRATRPSDSRQPRLRSRCRRSGDRLRCLLGRHLTVVEHLGDLEPRPWSSAGRRRSSRTVRGRASLLHVRRVTLHAALVQNRADLACKLGPKLL